MRYIPEAQSAAVITHAMAYDAAKAALLAAISPQAANLPVVQGDSGTEGDRFSIKAATTPALAGLKVGAFFPSNDARGLPRHASTILLIDPNSGRIGAVIEGSSVNCYRTAAANAVATDLLSRPDAKTLAIIGPGKQAGYEMAAVARIRPIETVLIAGRNPETLAQFAQKAEGLGLRAEITSTEDAVRRADIIVTATTSTAPLFEADWVQPGTHLSAMGADRPGKQELPPDLFTRAGLFCDLPEQSLRIGEFQHAKDAQPTALGAVISGAAAGRSQPDEITIFDSSGISLQDLYIAEALLAAID